MLRISKLTDYGVVLVTAMAARPEVTVTACDAARETGIPQPTVSKVLKRLARLGIVESHRGVHGGYRLSRTPEQISIAEVIRALEGPIAVTECSSETTAGTCEYENRCDVRANWQRINAAVAAALEGISLQEMARTSPPALVPLRRRPDTAATAADHQLAGRPGQSGSTDGSTGRSAGSGIRAPVSDRPGDQQSA